MGAARVVRAGDRAAPPAGARGAGGGRVHDQLRHVDVDADLLRPPRQPPARRLLPRQQRHPGLRLRSHGT